MQKRRETAHAFPFVLTVRLIDVASKKTLPLEESFSSIEDTLILGRSEQMLGWLRPFCEYLLFS
jgi:hypothetical protein